MIVEVSADVATDGGGQLIAIDREVAGPGVSYSQIGVGGVIPLLITPIPPMSSWARQLGRWPAPPTSRTAGISASLVSPRCP